MGGRGQFAPGPGVTGQNFSAITLVETTAKGFELNDLQRLILSFASDREVLTRDDSQIILDDSDLEYDFILDAMDDAMNPNLKQKRTSKRAPKSSTGKLRAAISFWKFLTGGRLPETAKAVLARSDIKAKYLTGQDQLSVADIKALVDQLGNFGEWLLIAYAAEVAGQPMPANVHDYE